MLKNGEHIIIWFNFNFAGWFHSKITGMVSVKKTWVWISFRMLTDALVDFMNTRKSLWRNLIKTAISSRTGYSLLKTTSNWYVIFTSPESFQALCSSSGGPSAQDDIPSRWNRQASASRWGGGTLIFGNCRVAKIGDFSLHLWIRRFPEIVVPGYTGTWPSSAYHNYVEKLILKSIPFLLIALDDNKCLVVNMD